MRIFRWKKWAAPWYGLLLLQLVCTVAAQAENGGAPETGAVLDDLSIEQLMNVSVYSASKFEQPLSEAPSSVTVVTADQIKKYGHRTLADVLRSLRGFQVTNDRTYSYVGVRGFGRPGGDYNSRILVLLDGHRINENIYDSVFINNEFILDVDLIDRIEVIRGPGSSLYGDNAFFAVVNVFTRSGNSVKKVEMSTEAGDQDTYKGRVSYGNSLENGAEVLLSGSFFTSGGNRSLYYPEFDPAATPDNPLAAHGGVAAGQDGESALRLFGKLSHRNFTLTGAYVDRRKDVPTASFGAAFDTKNPYVDRRGYVELKHEKTLADRYAVTTRVFADSYTYRSDAAYAYNFPPDPAVTINHDAAWNYWWGMDTQVSTTLLDSHRLIAGVELRDSLTQRIKNEDRDPFFQYLDVDRPSLKWGLYLQDEFTILKNLILNAGIRYDHFDTFGGTVNPRVALIYSPWATSTFKVVYGEAFRAPNTFEMFYDDGTYLEGNAGLKPEKIRSYEVMWEQLLGDHFRLITDGFYNHVRDLINRDPDPQDPLGLEREQFHNVGTADALGGEVELEGNWENGANGRVSYGYTHAWDSQTRQHLVNSPSHQVKGSLILPIYRDKIFAGTEVLYTSSRKTYPNNPYETANARSDDFVVVNLTLLSKKLLPGLELSGSLYNLFDTRYSDPVGKQFTQDAIAQDGRTFRCKLTYRF